MTLIDARTTTGRTRADLPTADEFTLDCSAVTWRLDEATIATIPNTSLALAHDDDGWWSDDIDTMFVDYLPANLPA